MFQRSRKVSAGERVWILKKDWRRQLSISEQKINFGTDGWRGIIAEDFTFENLGRLAIRISEFLSNKGKVCVGYDNRFFSPEYASFISSVLDEKGITVDLADKAVTTPCVSHRTNRNGYDLGIMISASHNPAQYNGIKIKEKYGGSARQELVDSIIENINSVNYSGSTWGRVYDGTINDWEPDYSKELDKVLPFSDIKVICDYMHGSAYPYFDKAISAKGMGSVSLRSNRDPFFGGSNPEPKPATLTGLIQMMKQENADIGFAFDGDGDRIALVDEKARLLSSQVILAVLAYDMLDSGKRGNIVKTVAGTYLIDRIPSDIWSHTLSG
ncbi:hypothetical protein ACFLTD_04010 [Elusimicrobiota bacterium]